MVVLLLIWVAARNIMCPLANWRGSKAVQVQRS
ncbi:hypothetical protein KP509_37G009000 [Ceratopteris richardii]|uniref:Uncharacterized protein n=1 Tax=Ceratopteris richardii TaxID=49495 RepID=A0A8T2Q6A8_CERRI|nr:hypothetical protein KP509_37G009000 [Ceratopteris richardii]